MRLESDTGEIRQRRLELFFTHAFSCHYRLTLWVWERAERRFRIALAFDVHLLCLPKFSAVLALGDRSPLYADGQSDASNEKNDAPLGHTFALIANRGRSRWLQELDLWPLIHVELVEERRPVRAG